MMVPGKEEYFRGFVREESGMNVVLCEYLVQHDGFGSDWLRVQFDYYLLGASKCRNGQSDPIGQSDPY